MREVPGPAPVLSCIGISGHREPGQLNVVGLARLTHTNVRLFLKRQLLPAERSVLVLGRDSCSMSARELYERNLVLRDLASVRWLRAGHLCSELSGFGLAGFHTEAQQDFTQNIGGP